jgi:hypothetical protein
MEATTAKEIEMTKQQQQTENIEKQATGSFGTYNPVAKVTCPHCGGIMQAIDAKKHIR